MNTISFAINFWSKGETKAMFLRHEGFLGALGAFLSDTTAKEKLGAAETRGSWIEKFIKYSTKAAHEDYGKNGGAKSSSPPTSIRWCNSYTSSGENLAAATASLYLETNNSSADSSAGSSHVDGISLARTSPPGLGRDSPATRQSSYPSSHQSRHRRSWGKDQGNKVRCSACKHGMCTCYTSIPLSSSEYCIWHSASSPNTHPKWS